MINMKRKTHINFKKIILSLSFVFIIILAFGYTAEIKAQDAPAAPENGAGENAGKDNKDTSETAAASGGDNAAPPAVPDDKGAKDTKDAKDTDAAAGAGAGAGEKTETAAPPADEPEAPVKEYTPRDKSKEPKDPFKPLIVPPPPVQPTQPTNQPVKPQTVKEVPPLPIKVTFIVGSDAKKIAVMSLNNKTYELGAGEQEETGLFKVLEVTDSSIKIFDSRVQKERTIPLQTN